MLMFRKRRLPDIITMAFISDFVMRLYALKYYFNGNHCMIL